MPDKLKQLKWYIILSESYFISIIAQQHVLVLRSIMAEKKYLHVQSKWTVGQYDLNITQMRWLSSYKIKNN